MAELRQRQRKYDILVWGATGYTGRLVAEYLSQITISRYPSLRWAIGGRNQRALEDVRAGMAKINPKSAEVDIVIGDVKNQELIEWVVGQTKVIIATAGPFSLVGTPIVEACVKLGVDYVDITGESQWVRKLINQYQYHEVASRKGIFIVPFCGFDSIPSDISSFCVADYIKTKLGKRCGPIRTGWFSLPAGGFSGGTFASMLNFAAMPTKDAKEAMDKYALNPTEFRPNTDPSDPILPSYQSLLNTWTTPFIMGSVNSRVVRRSNSLVKSHYGEKFSYMEYMAVRNPIFAGIITFGLVVLVILLSFGFTRELLRKVLPKPGQGPSKEDLKKGGTKVVAVGLTDEASPRRVECTLRYPKDVSAGYLGTAITVTEAALCLALQRDAVEKNVQANGLTGGVLTPASAFGHVLVQRLRDAGITVDVKEI
mmetsp:Transcript_27184/g.38284  ORF Transcript_27184/g.38284 Transcript_27184/m.38284 type:complete len:426 (+) Transcript_27184:183-1460(+)